MKVKSEVDLWFQLIVGTTIIITVVPIFMIPADEQWMLAVIALPTAGFLLWLVFDTWYQLRDDHLYCVSGPFREKIPYDKIKSVKYNFATIRPYTTFATLSNPSKTSSNRI
jgi:hypothetical protein